MKLSQIKELLGQIKGLEFQFEDESFVPAHFHITEIGLVHKSYIDCGGKLRDEKNINFQLWTDEDVTHRLTPEKLLQIIHLAEQKLGLEDLQIEVEYQSQTIGRYGLDFNGKHFRLKNTYTACLAMDACGIPQVTEEQKLRPLTVNNCSPGSGCC